MVSMVNKKSLVHPQEVEVFYIIPSIRKHITKLLKSSGMPQKKIALILGVRESTVSQYVSDKRANIRLSLEVQKFIKLRVSSIKNHSDLVRIIQEVLMKIRTSGEICKIHMKVSKVPVGCSCGISCHGNIVIK